jgi:hypothetical protein
MFTVEWLKDGAPIQKEAMLGANVNDVLRVARAEVPKVAATSGSAPDKIRVTDHSCNKTTIEKVDPRDALKARSAPPT